MIFYLTKSSSFTRKGFIKLIMKTFFFMFCALAFGLNTDNGFSQNAKVKINSDKKISVEQVFNLIKRQTNYNFVYRTDHVKDSLKIKVKKGLIEASNLLQASLNTVNCTYTIFDNTIIVKQKNENHFKDTQESFVISGSVVNAFKDPLAGLVVYLTNSKPTKKNMYSAKDIIRGTATDFDGKFSIKASLNNYLVIKGIGHQTFVQQITSKKSFYNVVLAEAVGQLEEVVIQVGYGTQKREQIGSAISKVEGTKINQLSIGNANFDSALGGLIKGVYVSQTATQPGAPANINIRGYTSPFSGSSEQPLFVINGVPIYTSSPASTEDQTYRIDQINPLLGISPSNIESIEVLKDAAATSIYGSRGANGVIIITTKKGEKNLDPLISINTRTTFSKPTKGYDVLNAKEYKEFTGTLFKNHINNVNTLIDDGILTQTGLLGTLYKHYNFYQPISRYENIADLDITRLYGRYIIGIEFKGLKDDFFGNADTNWGKELTRTGVVNEYDVSVRGGTKKLTYNFGASYINQESMVIRDRLKNYNYNLSLDSKIKKNLRVGINASLGNSNRTSGGAISSNLLDSFYKKIIPARPDISPYDENGNTNRFPANESGRSTTFPSPLNYFEKNHSDNTFTFFGNTYVELELFKGLAIKGDYNVGLFNTKANRFNPGNKEQFDLNRGPSPSELTTSKSYRETNVFNLSANYKFKLGNAHNFETLLGYSWDRSETQLEIGDFEGFPDDEVLVNATSAAQIIDVDERFNKVGLNSVYSRLNYGLLNKYFATVNFRIDESSKFGKKNRKGYFPSLALAWNLAREEFIKNASFINRLKLRGSVGRTGVNNIYDFSFFSRFLGSDPYNGQSSITYSPRIENSSIGWETTEEVNLGLDFSLFSNRLYGSFDAYRRYSSDVLTPFADFYTLGAGSYTANFSEISNRGFEIEIGGTLIKNKNFTWDLQWNGAVNKSKLELINLEKGITGINDYINVGEEVGARKGYRVEKIFQNNEEIKKANENAVKKGYDYYWKRYTSRGDYKFKDLNGDGAITDEDKEIIASPAPDLFGGFLNTISYKGFTLSAQFQYAIGGEKEMGLFSGLLAIGSFSPFARKPGENISKELAYNTWSPENPDARYAKLSINDGGFFGGDHSVNNSFNDRHVFDASYLRLRNVRLSYSLDQKLLKRIGLKMLTLTVSAQNIKTWTKWPGLNPASNAGMNPRGYSKNEPEYPLSKGFSFGVNIQL